MIQRIVSTIIDYFAGKDASWWSKLISVLVVIVLLVAINDIIGFSFYYENNRRATQVANINQCLIDNSLSNVERNALLSLRKKTIDRRNFLSSLVEYVTDIFKSSQGVSPNMGNVFNDIKSDSVHNIAMYDMINLYIKDGSNSGMMIIYPTTNHAQISAAVKNFTDSLNKTYNMTDATAITAIQMKDTTSPPNIDSNAPMRNNVLFFLASSWWLFILFFFLFVATIGRVREDKANKPSRVIYSTLIYILALFVSSVLLYWFFGLFLNFPITGEWWTTYLIVAAISGSIAIIPHFLFTKGGKF